jgi:hypothetical protein
VAWPAAGQGAKWLGRPPEQAKHLTSCQGWAIGTVHLEGLMGLLRTLPVKPAEDVVKHRSQKDTE